MESPAQYRKVLRQDATKQTDVGEIPISWTVVKLGDIATQIGSGITPRGGEKVYLKEGIPLIRSQNVLMNKLDLRDVAFISPDVHESMARSAVQRGDVLLNITGASIGRVAIVSSGLKLANVNQHVCRIRLSGAVHPSFVSYFLSSSAGQAQIMGSQFGTTRQGLNYGNVRAIRVPLPSLGEQKAIAYALETVQKAQETLQHELFLERERKAALMEYLFAHGTRGEQTKPSEIGEIPESWRLLRVDEIKADQRGSLVAGPFGSNIGKRFFVEKGVPVIRGNNLTKGKRLFIDSGFVFVTDEKANELKSCEAVVGDLVMTAAGTLGQVGLIPASASYGRYIISNKQIRLRVNTARIIAKFLFYWLSTVAVQNLIERRKSGTSIPVINLSVVRNLPVLVPSLQEQVEMLNLLEAADCKISALEAEGRALGELFHALLEELMSGQLSAAGISAADAS
jgi:type I restriction enzyme, S subunit